MIIKNYIDKLKNKYVPIKKDRVVFLSYNGHFCDSPKYLYDMMKELAPNLDYVWLVGEEYIKDIPSGTKYYIYGSKEAKEAYNNAHVIIDNVFCDNELYLLETSLKERIKFMYNTWCNKKRNQKLYSTWHGTPLKKMGIDVPGSTIKDFSRPNLTMFLNNYYTYEIISRLTFNRLKYNITLSPRSDVINKMINSSINDLKKKLKLPLDKKIILFAPTFRAEKDVKNKDLNRSGINQLEDLNFDKLFSVFNEKFGGDWILVFRFHYHVSEMANWEKIKEKYGDKLINGNEFDEMNDYLICADAMISDISSCLIDYIVTNKPAFMFFPDKDYFMNYERGGLYYDLYKLPFSLATSTEQLYKNVLEFDDEDYKKKCDSFIEELKFDNTPNSTEKIAEYILKDSKLKY